MATPFIVERVASRSPSSAGYRHDGGRASMALRVARTDTSTAHWGDVIEYVLGSTDAVGTNKGKITRKLPIACPDHPHMVADQIEEIVGIGRPIKGVSTSALAVPTLPAAAIYERYEMTVSFVPMRYPMLADDKIKVQSATAYDDEGTPYDFKYCDEYSRFCEWWIEDGFEIIQAQFGSRHFVTGSESPPHKTPFPGSVIDRVPRPVVHFKWHRVPYRYVSSRDSWMRRFKGRINQDDWGSWKAGELLYLDAKVHRYLPAIPTFYQNGSNTYSPLLGALCDVEFLFELREWENADAPTMTNASFIETRGHNLERWFMNPGKAYLSVSGDPDNPPEWVPKYFSFPIARLFSDPDVTPSD